LVRTGMYSFLFVRLGIMSRGPDRTFQGAVSGPRAVVCPSLYYPKTRSQKVPAKAVPIYGNTQSHIPKFIIIIFTTADNLKSHKVINVFIIKQK